MKLKLILLALILILFSGCMSSSINLNPLNENGTAVNVELTFNGEPLGTEDGVLEVTDGDVHNFLLNEHIHIHDGYTVNLTANATSGDINITVDSVVGVLVGDVVKIELNNINVSEIIFQTIIAINGNVLSLNFPIQNDFPVGSNVLKTTINMRDAVGISTASVSNPVTFIFHPQEDEVWHIQELSITTTDNAASDFSKFGGMPELPNGLLVRVIRNNTIQNLAIWNRNQDISEEMPDLTFHDKAGGGNFGMIGSWSFVSIGITIELDGANGDRIEVLIQDDITPLIDLQIKAKGHIDDI